MGKNKKTTKISASTWVKDLAGHKNPEKAMERVESIVERYVTQDTITMVFSKKGISQIAWSPRVFVNIATLYALEESLVELGKIISETKEKLLLASVKSQANAVLEASKKKADKEDEATEKTEKETPKRKAKSGGGEKKK